MNTRKWEDPKKKSVFDRKVSKMCTKSVNVCGFAVFAFYVSVLTLVCSPGMQTLLPLLSDGFLMDVVVLFSV